MLRMASFTLFLAIVFQAQGQVPGTSIQSTGTPASVISPTAEGRQRGTQASVVSPKPPIPGTRNRAVTSSRRTLRPFGTPRHHQVLIPVPLFYPAYGQTYDAESAVADPAVGDSTDPAPTGDDSSASADEEALRHAYLQGARDALARQSDRYGQHYLDSRENSKPKAAAQKSTDQDSPSGEATPDVSPTTVFIFKDGHQLETRNFAIMGQTLYDFSSNSLRKVQLSDLDTAATQKANDDRGITVKLP